MWRALRPALRPGSLRTIVRAQLSTSGSVAGSTCRIGCSSGFWGDTACAAPQLVHHGNIDYLVMDYLSEITMSLLTAAKKKSPEMGFTPDFVQSMGPLLKEIKQKNIKVLANAGGVNAKKCAEVLAGIAAEQGVGLNIAIVEGDDLMPKLKELSSGSIQSMDTGQPFPSTVQSMNAYLGAFPMVKCLELGADVVITGRCVDSALVLAPLMHEYGWTATDYDKLATGSLAGHLIECGAQCTGGIYTDWDKVEGWDNMGFPIVEFSDGSTDFVLTKPPNTGGLVTTSTATEQMLYEIGDPSNYMLPDVTCDFTGVEMENVPGQINEAVRIKGAKGKAPSDSYKVSATYFDGFRATAICTVIGPRAVDKAYKTADSILKRTRRMFQELNLPDYTDTNILALGSEEAYGPNARPVSKDTREVVLFLAVSHKSKTALEIFSREIAPAGTGMAPGLTGLVGGRPNVSPVLKLFSFAHPKKNMSITVTVNGETQSLVNGSPVTAASDEHQPMETKQHEDGCVSGTNSYRLLDLAFLKSGDKGDTANVGVIARHPNIYPFLRSALTADKVQQYFYHLINPSIRDSPRVKRYELDGTHSMNFVIPQSLGGGGVASLRCDPLGKAYGQMLGDIEMTGAPDFTDLLV